MEHQFQKEHLIQTIQSVEGWCFFLDVGCWKTFFVFGNRHNIQEYSSFPTGYLHVVHDKMRQKHVYGKFLLSILLIFSCNMFHCWMIKMLSRMWLEVLMASSSIFCTWTSRFQRVHGFQSAFHFYLVILCLLTVFTWKNNGSSIERTLKSPRTHCGHEFRWVKKWIFFLVFSTFACRTRLIGVEKWCAYVICINVVQQFIYGDFFQFVSRMRWLELFADWIFLILITWLQIYCTEDSLFCHVCVC